MTQTDPHTQMDWAPEPLWLKARVFVDRANQFDADDPLHAFWSSLALEMLARAALSHIHPTLLADLRNFRHLVYALGQPTSKQPRSIPAHSVYERLEEIVPAFGTEEKQLCEFLSLQRNRELHTAAEPFVTMRQGEWVARYYATCNVLCTFLGKSLPDYFGNHVEVAVDARDTIKAMQTGRKEAVVRRIKEYRDRFIKKDAEEQEKMRTGAKVAVTLDQSPGATVQDCPSCLGPAVLHGDLKSEESPRFIDGRIMIRQHFVSRDLRCRICGLVIEGRSEIVCTKIDPQFTLDRNATLHEMFEEGLIDGYMNM